MPDLFLQLYNYLAINFLHIKRFLILFVSTFYVVVDSFRKNSSTVYLFGSRLIQESIHISQPYQRLIYVYSVVLIHYERNS